jgi:flagellar motor switch/type III secretory pathway protein FliN
LVRSFRPYPFARLRRVSRDDAAFESAIARWLAARPLGTRVAKLAHGRVTMAVVGAGGPHDPNAVVATVRVGGVAIGVAGSGAPIRKLAQRLLGGPTELAAPRPANLVEHAIWALMVAAALEDLGIAGEVWPVEATGGFASANPTDVGRAAPARRTIELAVDFAGDAMTATCYVPPDIQLRAPPPRALPAWRFDLPVVVARCALPAVALGRLGLRDVIVVERAAGDAELEIGDGRVGLAVARDAVVGEVRTHYSARDMALPDEAHLELTVALGTTQLTVRQIVELSVGQIVALGRPLAGPFELRVQGRVVGRGELIDMDGELGVRIVSLEE